MADNYFFTRYALPGTVLFQPTGGPPRTIRGELNDISFRAISMYSKDELAKDTIVRFLLMSKEYDVRISGAGKVTYSQPLVRKASQMFRIGVEFTTVDSELLRDTMSRLGKVLQPKEPNQP